MSTPDDKAKPETPPEYPDLEPFLKAAGVKECLAIMTMSDGSVKVLSMTEDQRSEAGFMYSLEKFVSLRTLQMIAKGPKKTEERTDKKL